MITTGHKQYLEEKEEEEEEEEEEKDDDEEEVIQATPVCNVYTCTLYNAMHVCNVSSSHRNQQKLVSLSSSTFHFSSPSTNYSTATTTFWGEINKCTAMHYTARW